MERIQVEINDYIRLELLGYLECEAKWQGQEHAHPFWEIIYVPSGNAILYINNRISEGARQQFFIIEPMKKHKMLNASNSKIDMLYFGFEFQFTPSSMPVDHIGNLLLGMPETRIVMDELNLILENSRDNTEHMLNLIRPRILRILSLILTSLVQLILY